MQIESNPRLDITGAGSGVGEALATQYMKCLRGDLGVGLIGGRRKSELDRVACEVDATEIIPGDLFDPTSAPYQHMMDTRARVIAHCAAINIDDLNLAPQANNLRAAQNSMLSNMLDAQAEGEASDPRRLIVVVNSVTSYFARELEKCAGFPYMQMKKQQADIISGARAKLQRAGVDIAVLFPGAIRTDMLAHLPDDDKAVRMANMFGNRVKSVPGRADGIVQDKIFTPDQIGGAMAALINYHLAHGELPKEVEEWILATQADLDPQCLKN